MWAGISLWFWFSFPKWLMMLNIFVCVLFICIFSLEKCLVKSLSILNGLSVSLFLSCELFIYSGYSTIVRYVIYRYFLPFCMLFLHFLASYLWGRNIFNFDEVQLSIFIFHCLHFKCNKPLPNPQDTKIYLNAYFWEVHNVYSCIYVFN